MKKIVLKTALITVGAIVTAGLLIFSLWILISPQSMATVSEKLGNYDFAVTCAQLKYKYSKDTRDLARCAEDAILSGEDSLVIKYCEPLIENSEFDAVCRRRNDELAYTQFGIYAVDYRTYILGNLAVAQYRAGSLEKAVNTAERGEVQCFNKLIIEIVENGSAEDIERVQTAPESLGATEYVKGLIALLTQ